MGPYLRRLSCLVFACAVTVGVLATGPAMAAGAAVTGQRAVVCSGTPKSPGSLAGRYRSDVVVKGACEVNAGRAVIGGNLILNPGSALLAVFARNDKTGKGTSSLTVRGNLRVRAGATLLMGCNPQNFACLDDPHQNAPTLSSHDSVGGSLRSWRPLGVIVHNSSIGGDVTQHGGGGGRNCTPSGVFKLFQSPVYSTYEVSSVGGDVRVSGVRSCWMGMVSLHVGGRMVVWNNKLADPDAIEILANQITGNLSCRFNSRTWNSEDISSGLFPRKPLPNKVGGHRSGQCVLSSPTKPGGPSGPGPF
jgi:hypothetical protein